MRAAETGSSGRRVLPLLVALGALTGAGPSPGQDGPPPVLPPTFVDTVEVRVVNVDVIVVDADGARVTGLERGDFELLVDGRPVELSNFAAYDRSLLGSDIQVTLESDAAATMAGIDTPRAAPPSTWVVYVDQSNLAPGPRNEAVREARDFLSSALRPGDRTMVATFDGRSLKLPAHLSADRQPALETLDALRKQRGHTNDLRSRVSQLQREISALEPGGVSTNFQVENLRSQIASLAEEHAYQLRRSMQAMRDLLAMLAGVEGRLGLIWVGGGFETDPASNLYRVLQVRVGGRYEPGQNLLEDQTTLRTQNRLDYADLLEAVNASRVTVYSVFAGDARTAGASAEVSDGPGVAGPMQDFDASRAGSTLSAFAEQTGGRAFVGGGDLAQQLTSAYDDFTTYYSLGFAAPPEAEEAFHKLEVRVRRQGVRVVHRHGVQARGAVDLASDAATAALIAAAPPDNPFGVRVEAGSVAEAGRGRGVRVPLVVRVPIRPLTLLPDGDQLRAQLSFHLSVRDPDGGYRRLEPRPFEFTVPPAQLAAAQAQHVTIDFELMLEPGSYQAAVAVVDRLGAATSVATLGFEVRRPR